MGPSGGRTKHRSAGWPVTAGIPVLDNLAKLDPVTLTWTGLKGSGKADRYSEEGFTLLPDGSVLTVDVPNGTHAERYFPQTDTWTSAGNTVAPLAAFTEIGPQVLRPDGTDSWADYRHTGVYDVAAGKWSAGPDFPGSSNGKQIASGDVGAVLLPNGNVLVNSGAFLFEFDGIHLNPVPYGNAAGEANCYEPLLLPTGQVLCGFKYTRNGFPQSRLVADHCYGAHRGQARVDLPDHGNPV